MATKEISAVMALRVYDQDVDNDNLPRFPYEGWVKEPNTLSVTNGFAYGVFRNTATNEVVIAYRGTDGASGMMGYDGAANAALFLGMSTPQLIQAAQVYAEVLRLYDSDANRSNISFTGHSLGGGLAGIMAVYFNRPAIVFDAAPFQSSALSLAAVQTVVQALGTSTPSALLTYQSEEMASFLTRELAVASHYVEGEFLNATRTPFNTIYGANTGYQFGNQAGDVSAFAMHSQALLVTGLLSDSFRRATVTVQAALPVIMSRDYYSQDPAGSEQKNFLIDLIRSEQANIGNGKLSHFAADLHRLGQDLIGLNEAAQKAIVAQGVEWYYWQGTDYAGQEFSTRSGALLQYTSAQGANLPGAEDRSKLYVTPWLNAVYTANTGDTRFAPMGTSFAQWNVATSATTGAVALARDLDQTQMFIGQGGADTFTGGRRADVIFAGGGSDSLFGMQGNDQLYGGNGSDSLDGGAGDDALFGGAGDDAYVFATGHGRDTLLDADGQGSIVLNGVALSSGKKLAESDTVWWDATETYRIARVSDTQLLITPKAGGDSITVKNWSPGDLGLSLGEEVDEQEEPQPPAVYFGDQRAPRLGIEARQEDIDGAHPSYGVYDWSLTTWRPDGSLQGGIVQADFADVISVAGQIAAVKMFGFGGNDTFTGGHRADVMFAGAGNNAAQGVAWRDGIHGDGGAAASPANQAVWRLSA